MDIGYWMLDIGDIDGFGAGEDGGEEGFGGGGDEEKIGVCGGFFD